MRSAFNLKHQRKAERVQRLNRALHFAKICDSGFSRNALKGFEMRKSYDSYETDWDQSDFRTKIGGQAYDSYENLRTTT